MEKIIKNKIRAFFNTIWKNKLKVDKRPKYKIGYYKTPRRKHRQNPLWHFFGSISYSNGFPGGSGGKESVCNAGDPRSILGRKDPLEKGMTTHPNILPLESQE